MPEHPELPGERDGSEMPRPTMAPMILAVGIVLLGTGLATNLVLSLLGVAVFVVGLALWISQLLPGEGHFHEERVLPEERPQAITGAPNTVEQMHEGLPGYRMRLPLHVRPISAGIRGGIAGGVLMPVPAILWSLLSGHGFFYPINLLAGLIFAGAETASVEQLERFHPVLFVLAIVIHAIMCLVIGLLYGVLLPTLPPVPRPIAWGGVFMPILWTGASYVAMLVVNPALPGKVSWPWFLLSQFVYGITMPAVVLGARRLPAVLAGVAGGLVGGAAMALPAILWATASGHGFWYPVNVLAGMILPAVGSVEGPALGSFHAEWFLPAAAVHAVLSVSFGVLFALVTPRLPPFPAPFIWGGVMMPLLWTGLSYSLMGVVNPLLQEKVDWPWFIASQFVFGITAALVVIRIQTIPVPPAGTGPDTASLTR